MEKGILYVCVSVSCCHLLADLDGGGPAPVGEGEPAAGPVLQPSAGEGHRVLTAAPCDHTMTLTMTLSLSLSLTDACMYTYCV